MTMTPEQRHNNEDVMRSLGRIEGMLEEISTLPGRVRALEQWRSYIVGGMAFLTLLIAIALKVAL